jgi:hypothetical protein
LLLAECSLFILSRAFLEEYLPKHFFLFLIRIIIFHIVVARGVEDRVVIVVAVRIPVPNLLSYRLSLRLRL